jgi:hypothetical protein
MGPDARGGTSSSLFGYKWTKESGYEMNKAILNSKKKALEIAVAVLVSKSGRRAVYADIENGDGFGTRNVQEFCDEARGLVRGSQRLETEVIRVGITGLEQIATSVRIVQSEA